MKQIIKAPFKNKNLDNEKLNEDHRDSNEELTPPLPGNPRIIPRDEHEVSRRNIDMDALKVIRRLQSFGYQAFLVGGGVRDLLLNKVPKDFDVSTSASPEDIRDLFRNSRIIGRRFKLVHVYFKGGKIIEVSTFRANIESDAPETLAHDNTYGDAESDALRRDLTINGLFYNPEDFTVIDYVDGINDLDQKIVKIIGKPDLRFKEDPVRIIRAVRHAARIGFEIDSATAKSIKKNTELLSLVPTARLYEEVSKDLFSGSLAVTFDALNSHELIEFIFPKLDLFFKANSKKLYKEFLNKLENLDLLIRQGKDPLSELFYASFLIGHYIEEPESNDSTDDSIKIDGIMVLCRTAKEIRELSSNDIKENKSNESKVFKLPPISIRRGNRDKISTIAKELGNWFLPVTLTKREKAAIERLLVLRYKILTVNEENAYEVSDVINSIHSEERLHLRWLFEIVGEELTPLEEKVLSGKIKTNNTPSRSSRNRSRPSSRN
jgi:poly(A) polymerase